MAGLAANWIAGYYLDQWLGDGCYTLEEQLLDLALYLAMGPLGKALAIKMGGAMGRAAGHIPPGAMKTVANGTDNVATGAADNLGSAIRRFAADESGAVGIGWGKGLTPTSNTGLSRRFSDEKKALVEMANMDKRVGATRADMRAYQDLNASLPDPFPQNKVRVDEGHPNRGPHAQRPHGHVGPVDYIQILDP